MVSKRPPKIRKFRVDKEVFKQSRILSSSYYRKEKWNRTGPVFVSRNKKTGRLNTWFKITKDKSKLDRQALTDLLHVRLEKTGPKKVEREIKEVQREIVEKPQQQLIKELKSQGFEIETLARASIVILRFIKGKTPEILYTLPNTRFSGSFVEPGIISYNNYVKMILDNVQLITGMSLQEWVVLSKTQVPIKFRFGEWTYKIVASQRDPRTKKIIKRVEIIRKDVQISELF